MKKCRACQMDFEPTEAQIKKSNWICKPCRKKEGQKNREDRKKRGLSVSGAKMPREYFKEYEKEYSKKPEVKAARAEAARNRRKDPDQQQKILARDMTNKAIKLGRIKKRPCEVCGVSKVDAHHDDYFKPLDVRWLCRKHHAEHHAKARGQA